MKNKLALLFSASILSISSSVALADPNPYAFDIQCPVAQNSSDMLSNYGDFIAGYGKKSVNNESESQIYFKSKSSVKGIPAQLDHYDNQGVKYNSTTGDVTCSYASNDGETSFEVTYTLINGKGGRADMISNNKIHIVIPFGLKA